MQQPSERADRGARRRGPTRRQVLINLVRVLAGIEVLTAIPDSKFAADHSFGFLETPTEDDLTNPTYLIVCGDSLAGGVGSGHYDSRTTNRWTGDFSSLRAAGILVARARGWGSENVARSGARAQRVREIELPRIKEIVARRGTPRAVVISAGGNEHGVSLPNGLAKAFLDHSHSYVHSESPEFLEGIRQVENSVALLLADLRNVTRTRDIFLLGIPDEFGANVDKFGDGLSPESKRGLAEATRRINEEVRKACAQRGVTFVDLDDVLGPHVEGSVDPFVLPLSRFEMYEDAVDVVIRNGLKEPSAWAPWHPSAEAQPLIAERLNAAMTRALSGGDPLMIAERHGLVSGR